MEELLQKALTIIIESQGGKEVLNSFITYKYFDSVLSWIGGVLIVGIIMYGLYKIVKVSNQI